MIKGIGIDIVRVERIKKWLLHPSLIERYFNKSEIEESMKRGASAALAFAARFAAKEAFGKALGTGIMGISLKDIVIINDALGKPDIELLGEAKKSFDDLNGKNIFVSMTHEKDNAVAVVVIEG